MIQGDIGVDKGRIPQQRESAPPFVMDVKKPLRYVRRHTTRLIVFTDDPDFGRVEDVFALPCGVHLLNAHHQSSQQ